MQENPTKRNYTANEAMNISTRINVFWKNTVKTKILSLLNPFKHEAGAHA